MPADLYTYARLSNDVYTPGMIKTPLPVLHDDRYRNFAAKVYAGPGGSAIVSYAGTDDARDALVEDAGGIGLIGNTHVLHTDRAIRLAQRFKQRYSIVEVCGHSLGGGYAQLVARELDLTCVTFNAPGVSHMSGAAVGGLMNPINTTVGDLRNLYGAFVNNNVMFHFRHPQDVVSRIGTHTGTRGCHNLPMPSFSGVGAPASAHAIANIENWLKSRPGHAPARF